MATTGLWSESTCRPPRVLLRELKAFVRVNGPDIAGQYPSRPSNFLRFAAYAKPLVAPALAEQLATALSRILDLRIGAYEFDKEHQAPLINAE